MNVKKQTFNVVFHLRTSKRTDERFPIYARITIDGRRIEISVKQMIAGDDWNENRGMAKPLKEECRVLNNYLEQLRGSFVTCYRECLFKKKSLLLRHLRKHIMEITMMNTRFKKLMSHHHQSAQYHVLQ